MNRSRGGGRGRMVYQARTTPSVPTAVPNPPPPAPTAVPNPPQARAPPSGPTPQIVNPLPAAGALGGQGGVPLQPPASASMSPSGAPASNWGLVPPRPPSSAPNKTVTGSNSKGGVPPLRPAPTSNQRVVPPRPPASATSKMLPAAGVPLLSPAPANNQLPPAASVPGGVLMPLTAPSPSHGVTVSGSGGGNLPAAQSGGSQATTGKKIKKCKKCFSGVLRVPTVGTGQGIALRDPVSMVDGRVLMIVRCADFLDTLFVIARLCSRVE